MLSVYFTDDQISFVFSVFLSEAEIDNFFETNTVQHLALIFENEKSYVGREVTNCDESI